MGPLKPAKILFCLLCLLNGFFIGIFYAVFTNAAEGQGLAGGAIVLGSGVIAGIAALVLSAIYSYYAEYRVVSRLNKLLLLLLAVGFASLYIRKLMVDRNSRDEVSPKPPPTPTLGSVSPKQTSTANLAFADRTLGLGLFKPRLFGERVLYFYNQPNFEKSFSEHAPSDSMGIVQNQHGFDISFAPPWLVPDHIKLDYDLLYFRVISVSGDFLEIVVNSSTEQTAFVDRMAGDLFYWPDFLLQVNSIEPINREDNLVRIKPLSHSSPVSVVYAFLRPINVRDDWIFVELVDGGYNALGTGWVRWKKDGQLWITYSLLS